MKKVGKTTGSFRYDLNQIPYDYTVELRNRFKGLDLIECLMNYGQRFVTLYRRQGSRPSPRKRNTERPNGCLGRPYIAVKRREVKSKAEKGRYAHLNAEFQRIARRDKKAFLGNQCKEIDENNIKGKTRDLFKKIKDTKGIFHPKIGSIKDGNGMDLIEAEAMKKRQEYTEERYKKDLHDPDNHNGVITHPEPNIMECEQVGLRKYHYEQS